MYFKIKVNFSSIVSMKSLGQSWETWFWEKCARARVCVCVCKVLLYFIAVLNLLPQFVLYHIYYTF